MHNLHILSPEISLICIACFNTLLALFTKRKMLVMNITAGLVTILAFCLIQYVIYTTGLAFDGSFVNNNFTMLFKGATLIGSIFVIITYIGHIKNTTQEVQTEFVSLLLLSITGSFVALSARDMIVLFLGLELQSLPAYILASFATQKIKSSEAGLKYFILGALSSAILLFGASFIYGSVGHLDYISIATSLEAQQNIATIVGISLVLIGILFKLSVAPFHMWTPDVYEGAPVLSVAVFSSIHKIAMIGVLVNLIALTLGKFIYDFVPILKFFAILSLIIGAVGGIFQKSLKRMIAYSTILNIGYILLAIIADIYLGLWKHSLFTYIVIYAVAVIALFSLLSATFGEKADDLTLDDIAGLGKTKKTAALSISIAVFSMIGIPPLAGFLGKYYVLLDLINTSQYKLTLIAIAASIVASYYYLRIIKSIYFEEPVTTSVKIQTSWYQITVISLCIIFLLCFIFGFAEYKKFQRYI